MSDPVSVDPTKQAQELIAAKTADRPLDDLSMGSITAVSDAAELIAMAKIEAAAKAAEAAREAMARVAAMKAAAAQPPTKTLPNFPPSSKEPQPAAATRPAAAAEVKAAPVAPPVAPIESAPVATVSEPKAVEQAAANTEAAPEPAVDRREATRREDQPRRTEADRRQSTEPVNVERRITERRMALGRREDDPSGVFRLANSIRATHTENNDRRRSVDHGEAPKVGGAVLEPVARKAGHGPQRAAGPRKVITPKLIMLFALMGLYGAYITGHLPQFDEFFDSMNNKAHANNDQVVNAVSSSGHIIVSVIAGLVILVIAFFVWNSMRARESY